jgi:hypothetical protein
MSMFPAPPTSCASCEAPIAAIEHFWPGLGLICPACHQAVLRPTLRPTILAEQQTVPVGPVERHEFRRVTIGRDKQPWWQCPTC